jgi:hypothetical protein
MNCFNIREVEALLKGRFFPDLVTGKDSRSFLNSTTLGLRFKTNNLDSINSGTLVFNNYGLTLFKQQNLISYNTPLINKSSFYEFFIPLRVLEYFFLFIKTSYFIVFLDINRFFIFFFSAPKYSL